MIELANKCELYAVSVVHWFLLDFLDCFCAAQSLANFGVGSSYNFFQQKTASPQSWDTGESLAKKNVILRRVPRTVKHPESLCWIFEATSWGKCQNMIESYRIRKVWRLCAFDLLRFQRQAFKLFSQEAYPWQNSADNLRPSFRSVSCLCSWRLQTTHEILETKDTAPEEGYTSFVMAATVVAWHELRIYLKQEKMFNVNQLRCICFGSWDWDACAPPKAASKRRVEPPKVQITSSSQRPSAQCSLCPASLRAASCSCSNRAMSALLKTWYLRLETEHTNIYSTRFQGLSI